MSFLTSTINRNRALLISFLIILILGFLQLKQCNNNSSLSRKLAVAEQNVKVAQDSIRLVKDAAGNAEYDKLAYLTNKNSNLEKLNSDLAKEIKTVKGKVSTIVKSTIKIVHDTVPVMIPVTGSLIDSIVRVDFSYNTVFSPGNSRSLKGYTSYNLITDKKFGVLQEDNFSVKIITGIKNLDKGKPEIFIKSDYPGFTVTELEGASLDPSLFKSKTHLIRAGINIGWTPLNYSLKTKKLTLDMSNFGVGVGVNINILKLLKPGL